MELLGVLLRGLFIGFSIAAPVGYIGMLRYQANADRRALCGFLVWGLGAASADAAYGCVDAFGLTSIGDFLVDQQLWLRLVGEMFLLYLSLRTFRERLGEGEAAITSGTSYRGLAGTCVSSFFLTNTNPSTILSLAAIFAGLGLIGKDVGYIPATSLVLGVFWGQPWGGCS